MTCLHALHAGSQGAQSIGLYLNLGGSEVANMTRQIASQLVNNVIAQDYHPTIGTIGSRFVLQALSMVGRGDVALQLANQTAQPSWGFFVSSALIPTPPPRARPLRRRLAHNPFTFACFEWWY